MNFALYFPLIPFNFEGNGIEMVSPLVRYSSQLLNVKRVETSMLSPSGGKADKHDREKCPLSSAPGEIMGQVGRASQPRRGMLSERFCRRASRPCSCERVSPAVRLLLCRIMGGDPSNSKNRMGRRMLSNKRLIISGIQHAVFGRGPMCLDVVGSRHW